VIELKGEASSVVEAMVQFMYRFDYDDNRSHCMPLSPMHFNACVYSIADKYCLPALKLLAKRKFNDAVQTCWDAQDFPGVIMEAYRATPPTDRGLRDLVVQAAGGHIQSLLKTILFRQVVVEEAGFALDLFQYLADYGERADAW
jgi:hypothetical protein